MLLPETRDSGLVKTGSEMVIQQEPERDSDRRVVFAGEDVFCQLQLYISALHFTLSPSFLSLASWYRDRVLHIAQLG